MFADAGITAPPATPDELLADAIKLTTADHAGFCVRADKSQTLYDGFQMWNWFVPWDNPVTGTYFDQNWNFLIGTEPQASKFGTFYRDLLTKAAPKGIATYLVTNCLSDFQQGRVAMWQDDSGSIPDVLDPNKSKVASDAAFWEVPCQPVNPDHCALVQPFGTWMNAASKHKEAAWQLIQFLTSKETQAAAAKAKALLTPSRNSVLKDPTVIAAFPPTFPEALTYILAHPDVALLPFIPEGVAIIPPISDGLSALITTNDPVASIMAQMKAGEASIMTKAGYPKPFPSFTAP
jgi:multiple sugar transport system substrate-binding protein